MKKHSDVGGWKSELHMGQEEWQRTYMQELQKVKKKDEANIGMLVSGKVKKRASHCDAPEHQSRETGWWDLCNMSRMLVGHTYGMRDTKSHKKLNKWDQDTQSLSIETKT